MNYLAVDTSARHLTVALKIGDKIKTSYIENSGTEHSSQIMVEIENCFAALNATPSDVDVFCAVVGPGSFTGIRIGVATVKGFADAFSKKVLGVTSFEVLAYNVKSEKTLAVVDANHDHFYVCAFDGTECRFSPEFVDGKRALELAKTYSPISFDYIERLNARAVDPVQGLINAVEDNLSKASADVNSLKPFYLRLSQAEEGRK
ncbi:MAG: tRNA (adenosine(37)-N6)-threonylcarbamoyltransferase complex dimerization subunit type 1 TsaB [Clostridia bacterium]|nr:tRNA (adenosine(37)-N6)-threonylcarbamoyltransferase complex dimerization subunit type 1 TsaB [Clostridia bacterium]